MTARQREDLKDVLQLAIESQQNQTPLSENQLLALCGGDEEVHSEIKRLLAARGKLGEFLERPQPIDEEWRVGLLAGTRYRLLQQLGEGGFGIAYLAADESLRGRNVVVKLLKRGVFARESLQREIQALTEVHHTGVVGILDAGTHTDGRQYLVLRYAEGPSLRQVLEQRVSLGIQGTRKLLLQMGEGVAACHRKGILHLDLKPENIVIQALGAAEEQAIILDFGVAAVLGDEPQHSARIQSARYKAPESVLSERSDIYSLGAIATECLTGKPGYSASAHLPDAWRRWALRCGAPEPTQRWRSVDEMLDHLPGKHQSWRWAGIAAALTLALLMVRWGVEAGYPRLGEFAPLTSDSGDEEEPTVSDDGRKMIYAATAETFRQFNLSLKTLPNGPTVNLTLGIRRESQPAMSPDGKRVAFARSTGDGLSELIVLDLAANREVMLFKAAMGGHCWSADGSFLIASLGEDRDARNRLFRVSVPEGTRQLLYQDPTQPEFPRDWNDKEPKLSRDGERLLFLRSASKGSQDVYMARLKHGGTSIGDLRRLTHMGRSMRNPRWSEDGKSIFFLAGTSAHMGLWITGSDGGTHEHHYKEAGENLDYLETAAAPDRLIVSRSLVDQNIWSGTLHRDGEVSAIGPIVASTWDDEEQRVSPDGHWLAFNSHRSGAEELWISDTRGANQRQLTRLGTCEDLVPIWRFDSKAVIARCSEKGVVRRIEVNVDSGLNKEFQLAGLLPGDHLLAWSGDGKWLYVRSERGGQGRLEFWRIAVATGAEEKLSWRRADVVAEGKDGSIFFASRNDGAPVYRLDPDGKETVAVDRITRRMFALGKQGIYFIDNLVNPVLRYRSWVDGTETRLMKLQKRPGFGFAVTPGEKQVIWTQLDRDGTDLYVAPLFRR